LAIAGGLAAYPVVRAGSLSRVTVPLAVIGLLLVVSSIVSRGRSGGAALFVLAVEYLVVQLTGRVSTISAIGYAVGLMVLCELLFFTAGLPQSGTVDSGVIVGRLLRLALTGVGAAVVAVLVLAAGGWRTLGAAEAALIGMAAVVAICALPWVLVRQKASETRRR
jgi:hypothetical protein